jgi:hypothetical protein
LVRVVGALAIQMQGGEKPWDTRIAAQAPLRSSFIFLDVVADTFIAEPRLAAQNV